MTNTKRNCCYGLTSLALLACAPAARAVAQDIPRRTTGSKRDRGTPYLDTVFDSTWATRLE